MVINAGELWDKPIPVADQRSCLPSIYSEIVYTETLPIYNIKDYQDYDIAECMYFKSLSSETNLGSNSDYSLSVCDVIKDEEQICSKKQPKSCYMMKKYTTVSSKSDGGKGHGLKAVDIQTRENMICRHTSKAFRVRSSAAKDRHSKVKTAKGLRDTRVRLSLSTALQFYEVQNRLGFDHPSKTLDWLINKAETAIDQLPEASNISKSVCSLCNSVSNGTSSSAKDRVIFTYSQTKPRSSEHAPDITGPMV